MPATHVAFLRGINVGKAKRIAMADLRRIVEGLGYGDVRTLLNSGNVVFSVPARSRGAPGPRIEKAVEASLGISAAVTVLDAAELAAILEGNPLRAKATDPSRLLVSLLQGASDVAKLKSVAETDWTPELIALGPRCAWLWCPSGVLESRVLPALSRAVRNAVTTRNWATLSKLHALAGA